MIALACTLKLPSNKNVGKEKSKQSLVCLMNQKDRSDFGVMKMVSKMCAAENWIKGNDA